MDDLFFLGRIIFGGYFLVNGANHFMSDAMFVQYAAAKGVPMPEIAIVAAGLLIVVGGLSVLLGLWPHVGTLCIVLFLLGVSPIMHNFWAITDPAERTAEMVNFTKNMALLGGALMMVGIPRPWPYSLGQQRRIAA